MTLAAMHLVLKLMYSFELGVGCYVFLYIWSYWTSYIICGTRSWILSMCCDAHSMFPSLWWMNLLEYFSRLFGTLCKLSSVLCASSWRTCLWLWWNTYRFILFMYFKHNGMTSTNDSLIFIRHHMALYPYAFCKSVFLF